MHDERRLRADCDRCVALCCVAPAFAASADFAIDKPAGRPCPNLGDDHRCGIHEQLRERGFPGCVAYDCFGAGQRVAQELLPGADWRRDPSTAPALFAALAAVRLLHELLWHLDAALALPAAAPLDALLRDAYARTDALAARTAGPDAASEAEIAAHREGVADLLRAASAMARTRYAGTALDRRGADMVGSDLRATGLRGADLRGALLLGADLRGVDLALADLTGADLRGADLAGADLREALFVTTSQLASARGDLRTRLAPGTERPAHWGGPLEPDA
jgi:hypothetical protein